MTFEPELAAARDVPSVGTTEKRSLIEAELHKDPNRSNRQIAAALGNSICHKTVGAARERLGIASPLSISPTVSPTMVPVKPKPPEDENHFLPESETLVLPSQPAIAVYTNGYGQVVIRQEET